MNYDGIILMGPFGSGKTYLGYQLDKAGIASYLEMEPIIYDRFENDGEFDKEGATNYLRKTYSEQLRSDRLIVLESTGVVQRPLLLELMRSFEIALVWVQTPKLISLERVDRRNKGTQRPIENQTAADFWDMWTNEIAPTYQFDLVVDGTDADGAILEIAELVGFRI